MINEILQNSKTRNWEETSRAYCRLKQIALNGGGNAIFFYKEEWEISAAQRELEKFNIKIIEVVDQNSVKEFFNKHNYNIESAYLVSTIGINLNNNRSLVKRILNKFCKNNDLKNFNDVINKNIIKMTFPYWRNRREQIFIYAKKHVDELEELISKLGDEISKKTLCEIIRCSAENDIFRYHEGEQDDKYFECYRHDDNEIFVNCGSATGDTILKYLSKGYEYSKIYAYEGDKNEYNKLIETLSDLNKNNILPINEYIGMDEEENNFNEKFKDVNVSLVNMDIEGAEMGVLRGMDKIIKLCNPVLAICAYHKPSDLLDIPNYIWSISKDYNIYLRKYIGFEPNALNEYLYYAVPKDRCIF